MTIPICRRFYFGAVAKVVLLLVLNCFFAVKAFAQLGTMTKRYMTGGVRINNFYDKNRKVIDPNKDTSFVMKVFVTKEGSIYEEIQVRFNDLAYDSFGIGRHKPLGRIVFLNSEAAYHIAYGIYYSEQPKGARIPFCYRLVMRYKKELMVVDLLGFMQEKYLERDQFLEPEDPKKGGGIMDSLVFKPGYFRFDYGCDSIQKSLERSYSKYPILYYDGLTQYSVPLLIDFGCLQYIPEVEQSITKELELSKQSSETGNE